MLFALAGFALPATMAGDLAQAFHAPGFLMALELCSGNYFFTAIWRRSKLYLVLCCIIKECLWQAPLPG
ncbi:MAG TPA: hypothetical protein VFP11_16055, partial [Candidatus Angelobacter sp.]|nr:hypothetical protein [Candidatus Angelobacter sp.]